MVRKFFYKYVAAAVFQNLLSQEKRDGSNGSPPIAMYHIYLDVLSGILSAS